jgi:hypothetical protein
MNKVFIDRITIDLCTQSEIDQVKEQTTEAIKNLAQLIYDLNQDFLAYKLGIKKPEDKPIDWNKNPIDWDKEVKKAEKEAEKILSQKDFNEAYKKAEIKTNKQTTKPTGGKEQTAKWKIISHKCECGSDFFKTMKNDTRCPECKAGLKLAVATNKIAPDANKSTIPANNHVPFDQY